MSRGWTQPLHAVRRIRTGRILLSSPEAGRSPYTASGGSGLSGSSCRIPRLDTAPTQRPEDPDCPDPPVESRGWTAPTQCVKEKKTMELLGWCHVRPLHHIVTVYFLPMFDVPHPASTTQQGRHVGYDLQPTYTIV